jgi:hypothetical protein
MTSKNKTYSMAKTIYQTMNDNAPVNELWMAICMPKIIGTWHFVCAVINCFMVSQSLTKPINVPHPHSNPPFLNMKLMPLEKAHHIMKA